MTEQKGEYILSPLEDDEAYEVIVNLADLQRVAVRHYAQSTSAMAPAWFQNLVLIQIALQLEQLNRTLSQLVSPQREE